MSLYRGIVISSYVVFFCNLIVSYYHALKLFKEVGDFPGILAHIAVIGVDTVFAITSLVISNGIMRKIRIGFPIWLVFLAGLAITGYSNVRASMVSGGWEGIAVGLAVPISLLGIKLVLAWMVANRKSFEKQPKQQKTTTTRKNKKPKRQIKAV